MTVLITGANGFIGYYLSQLLLEKGFTVIATGKGECRLPFIGQTRFIYHHMNITEPFSIHDVFEMYKPEVVVHTAAMTKPDECEVHQREAYLINVESTISLLVNAGEYKSHFVFLSTDFVFDGEKGMYNEEDKPDPVNYYGKTKLQAEEAVKEYENNWTIIRIITAYGRSFSGRENLIELMKNKLEKGEPYSFFDDQYRTPTYIGDLVKGIATVIQKKATGIFHLSGKEIITPYQMACLVAKKFDLDKSIVKKVTSVEFHQLAKRPSKTGFIIEKARKELGFDPVTFEEGLKKMFE